MGRKSFVSPVSDPSRLPKTKTNNSQQQAENDDEGQNDNQIEKNVNQEEEQETENKQTTNIDDNGDNDQSTTTAIASTATTTDHVENDENNDGEEKESSSSSPPPSSSTESSATEQQEESSSPPPTTTTATEAEEEEEEEASSSTGIEFEDEEDDYESKTSKSEKQKNKDSSKKKRKRSSKTSPENESGENDNEEQQEDEEEEDEDYQADEIMGDEDEQKSKSNNKKKRTSKRLNKKQKTSSEDDNEEEEEEGEGDDGEEKKKKKKKKGKKSSSSSTPADYDEEDDVSSSSARASSSVIADDEDETFSASSESRRSGNSEFAQVLERIKTKRHTTGELTQIDDEAARLADDLIAKMSFAIEQDKISMQNRQPAMAKLSMLSEVQKAASKVYLQQPLLDRDFLAILANWLTPPHKQLPNINLRNAVLDILTKLPIQGDKHSGKRSRDNEEHEDDGITKELIEKTIGITRAVGMLASHPKETIDNKKKAKYLIERWKRLLYELPDDYSQFSVPVVHRDRTPRPSATSLNQKVRLSEEEEAKIRTSTRARTPQRINFDFQKRPPNRLEDKDGSSSAFANPTHQSLEKKFAKKRR